MTDSHSPNPPDPDDGSVPQPGPDNPRSGGGRRLKFKRVGIVVVLLIAVIGGGVVMMSSGLPSIPSIGGCSMDGSATVVFHQEQGSDGHRVAIQVTEITDADNVTVSSGNSIHRTLSAPGNTTTVTGLSTGDTLTITAHNKCGDETIEKYRVN